MAKDKINCYACLYNEGKAVDAVYLTIVLGSDERWGACYKHYSVPCKHEAKSNEV